MDGLSLIGIAPYQFGLIRWGSCQIAAQNRVGRVWNHKTLDPIIMHSYSDALNAMYDLLVLETSLDYDAGRI